jgi:flagellar biosynthetic protein FliR
MEIADYIAANLPTFLFVLIRTASILMVAPIFGALLVPGRVKMALIFLIALLLAPIIDSVPMPGSMLDLMLCVAGEMVIGMAFGLVIRFVFVGVEVAGQVMSFQMGLSMAKMYDPINAAQVTVIGRFINIYMLLIFLAVNGHLMVLMAFKKSFDIIPPYGFHLNGILAETMLGYSKDIFILGVKFAAPVIAVLLFVNSAIGLLAKLVPQINMFVIGFAIAIPTALLMLFFSIPVYETAIEGVLDDMWGNVFTILRMM